MTEHFNASHGQGHPKKTIAFSLGLFMLFLGVVGVFGNITSIVIFSRKGMRSPLSILLVGVTVADLVLILLCLLTFVVPNLTVYAENEGILVIVIFLIVN